LVDWQRLLGHRQVTDAYLLALAVRNNGRLATFDQRVSRDMVVGAKPSHLELIV
jgi:predicted nucleic acid-binding protein